MLESANIGEGSLELVVETQNGDHFIHPEVANLPIELQKQIYNLCDGIVAGGIARSPEFWESRLGEKYYEGDLGDDTLNVLSNVRELILSTENGAETIK